MKYLRRGSGYYIDVGAADLVANGDVKLVQGQVDHLTEDAVVLEDGTELPADLVVYATGYGSMNGWAADLIDQEAADRVGKVWGLGLGHHQGPRPVGGRAAQHVEADPAGGAVVPRRQPAPVAALLALPRPAAQGPRTRASTPRSTACRRCTTPHDRQRLLHRPRCRAPTSCTASATSSWRRVGPSPTSSCAVATYGDAQRGPRQRHPGPDLVLRHPPDLGRWSYVGPRSRPDPDRWFIVVVNQIGNGLSTSPHTTDGPDRDVAVPARRGSATTSGRRSGCCASSSASSGWRWSSAARWARSRPTSGRCASPTRCCGPPRSRGRRRTPRTTSCSPRR